MYCSRCGEDVVLRPLVLCLCRPLGALVETDSDTTKYAVVCHVFVLYKCFFFFLSSFFYRGGGCHSSIYTRSHYRLVRLQYIISIRILGGLELFVKESS